MYHRSPYGYAYPSSYYDDSYGYGGYSPYAARLQAQAQALAEQKRRAETLALERERERQRELARQQPAAQLQQQRASQYLPEAGAMKPRFNHQGRIYNPERASMYLPEEFNYNDWDNLDNSMEDDAHDYGFGRAGSYWDGLTPRRGRRPSKSAFTEPQAIKSQQSSYETQSKTSLPVPTHQASSGGSPPAMSDSSSSQKPPSPSPHPPSHVVRNDAPREVLDEAATKIQTAFRLHRSLKTIQTLHQKFLDVRSSFNFPSTLDYQVVGHDHHISIPTTISPEADLYQHLTSQGYDLPTVNKITTPKLAYTHTNVQLHGYVESLNRLLTSLDGINSYGEKAVREKRKEVVRAVETEAARIDLLWKQAWEHWLGALNAPKSRASGPVAEKSISPMDVRMKEMSVTDVTEEEKGVEETPSKAMEEEEDEGFVSASDSIVGCS